MSRTRKFMYNSFYTGVYQFIIMIAGFITPSVMLTAYGSEVNGLVSSVNQFITYFNLVEAGLAGAAVYSLYKPLANQDFDEINGIVSAAKIFYKKSGYLFAGLVMAMAVIYPLFVKSDDLVPRMVGYLILALGAKGILEFFTLAKYRVLLTADQKTYVISIVSSVYVVLNTIVIVILAKLNAPVIMVYIAALAPLFVRTIILMIYIKCNYSYIDYKVKPNYEGLSKRWDALYLQVLSAVQMGTPTILATIFTNLKSVSVYSIYNMVLLGINGVLGIFTSGLAASFGDIIIRKEQELLQKTYKEFEFIYYIIITIVYSASFILILPFIKIYTWDVADIDYTLPLVGFLFVLNGLLYNLKTPQGMLIISAGMYRETRAQSTIQGAIIIIIGGILGLWFGLPGILIGSCFSNLYRDFDVLWYVPKHITKLSIRGTVIEWGLMALEIIIINIPFFVIKLETNSYATWSIYAIGVVVYATIVVLVIHFIFKRKQLNTAIERIKRIIRGRNNDSVCKKRKL